METKADINPHLKALFPVAESIGALFGRNCEIVIHDLAFPQSSVVKVVNGGVTGRKVGQGIRDLVISVLLSDKYSNDMLANYRSLSSNNEKVIKSSTALIRDQNGKPIGAFCINFDITNFLTLQPQLNELTYTTDVQPNETRLEDLPQDVMQVVDLIIEQSIQSVAKPIESLSKNERMEIVEFLDEKGVFLIKGGIEKVASALRVSRYTIYSYLDNLKQKSNNSIMY